MEDNFSMDGGQGREYLGMIQVHSLTCTLFLFLLHQLHPRQSGIRSGSEAGDSYFIAVTEGLVK